ncbi:MAG: tetratricopeptide repeat protein [Bdellovibrionota bacterium]
MVVLKNVLRILTAFLITAMSSLAHSSESLRGQIAFQDDTVHFELNGAKDWTYDIQKKKSGKKWQAEMLIEGLDEKTEQNLVKFKNDLITAVKIARGDVDGKVKVIFDLASADIEVFDYLTDQPSRLIVDFYENKKLKSSDSLPKKTTATNKESLKDETKVLPSTKGQDQKRKPATADYLALNDKAPLDIAIKPTEAQPSLNSGIFDGADPFFERFSIKDHEVKEDAIIKSKENYYIAFPHVEFIPMDFIKIISAPNIYSITEKEKEENKQARLLLTLFERGRTLVYLKTLQWFNEKYPESEYNEVIDLMTVEIYLKQWRLKNDSNAFSLAQQKLQSYSQRNSPSVKTEKASFLLGALNYVKGDYFEALRFFLSHKENKTFPQANFSKDLAQLGMGLSFMKIKKFKEAIDTLTELEAKTGSEQIKRECAFRLGDIYLNSKETRKAVEEYKRAQKLFPGSIPDFPNSIYNQAQAYFDLGQYRESLDTYREFIKLNPNHENVAYAMTRIGELLEILGADREKVLGAYLETYFRNGENPAAIVARLRLLSAKMVGMKGKEVEQTTQQILELSKKLDLPSIQQFSTVMIADGYQNRGEYNKSIDLLASYYQQNPNTVDAQLFQKRIIANINEKIMSELNEGQFIQALKTHKKYSDNWLKFSQRTDTSYYLGRAYELAGVPAEASEYYQGVLNKIYSLQGTQEGKEKFVKEKLPSIETLNLRMANVEFQQGRLNQSYNFLKNIKKPDMMSEDDQVERILLAVKVFENRGDLESAVRYLTEILRTWRGQAEKVAEPYYQLGLLEVKQKRIADALNSFERVRTLMEDTKLVDQEIYFKSLEKLAQINLERNNKDKAIEIYSEMLEKFEDKRPLAAVRYRLGKIQFDQGNLQKANEIWTQFKGEKFEFWKNLAQEQLQNSDWKQNYKKYIQRIPAMSDKEAKPNAIN